MAAARPRVDGRCSGILLTVLLVLLGGALVQGLLTHNTAPAPASAPAARPDPRSDPAGHERSARAAEVRRRFDEAVVMLHAKRFDHAVTALHRVLELSPQMPEAHVNMGFALLGMGRHAAARDFFNSATELAPGLANAYYGMAVAYEALGDLPLALSAMRTFVHRARPEDQPYLARARAALWEWESRPRPDPAPRP